jgi:hypothetical protein
MNTQKVSSLIMSSSSNTPITITVLVTDIANATNRPSFLILASSIYNKTRKINNKKGDDCKN